jgi:arabinose-5-phosphate isomerase
MTNPASPAMLERGRQVLVEQGQALLKTASLLGQPFLDVVSLLCGLEGHLVVSGVGKSGLIGKKMAATLASTGTPAFWLHPTEAFHGDLGSITSHDCALLISYSGETEELVRLVPALRAQGVPVVAMTGKPSSSLARLADHHLSIAVERETCPHNLAPTTSTTVTLALGDALAVALMHCRGFAPEDFAKFHPGGSLGRSLALVSDRMRTEALPTIGHEADVSAIVRCMTDGRLGLAVILDEEQQVTGVITDGDVRRAIERILAGGRAVTAAEIMTARPVTVQPHLRMAEARALLERHRIKSAPVVDEHGRLVGVLDWTFFV